VYLAVKSITRPGPIGSAADDSAARAAGPRGLFMSYTSAVALTLTNPMTIIAFAAVFMSAGLADVGGPQGAVVATFGVFAGSLGWWLVLCSAVALVRHRLAEGTALWLSRGSAVAVGLFGLLAIGSVFV